MNSLKLKSRVVRWTRGQFILVTLAAFFIGWLDDTFLLQYVPRDILLPYALSPNSVAIEPPAGIVTEVRIGIVLMVLVIVGWFYLAWLWFSEKRDR